MSIKIKASQIKTIAQTDGLVTASKKIIHYIWSIVDMIIGLILSFVFPRIGEQVVFVDGMERPEFSGNMKYLFLRLENEYNKDCVWITQYEKVYEILSERGYNVYWKHSLKARQILLRSKHAATQDDFSRAQWGYLHSAEKYQLWHGFPLKNLPDHDLNGIDGWLQVFDHACVNSPVEAEELTRLKQFKKYHCTGYPRNDLFFNDITDSDLGVSPSFRRSLDKIPSSKSVIGYFPTWRRDTPDINPINIEQLSDFLRDVEAHFIMKPHQNTNPFDPEEYERIHIHPPFGDVYPLFEYMDIMITDYSSIYFDFLFLDRPVVFYPYDYEEYQDLRGLNLDYEEATPGPKAFEFEELLFVLDNTIHNDKYREQRKEVRKATFGDFEGSATENILNIMKSSSS